MTQKSFDILEYDLRSMMGLVVPFNNSDATDTLRNALKTEGWTQSLTRGRGGIDNKWTYTYPAGDVGQSPFTSLMTVWQGVFSELYEIKPPERTRNGTE